MHQTQMNIKFLIIRFSSIGDIILTTPVIRCIKKQVNKAEIHFVTKEKHAVLLQSNPNIDHLYLLKDKLSDLLAELGEKQFDYIIDLHQNYRSNRLKQHLKIPAFSFDKLNLKKWLLVNLKINKLPHIHIVDRYMETVSVFDVKNDGQGLDFFIPEKARFNFNILPEKFKKGYIAFCIAATYFTKRLPLEKVIEICKLTDKPVILLGGINEFSEGEQIALKNKGNILNLCGKTTINESADIIFNSNIVLTNDTGLMHVSAAFRKKILSFWGNTIPELGMYPYQPDPASKIMEVKNLKCRPCSKLGYHKCPKKHFKCMLDIDIQYAINWIKKNY